MKDTGLLQIEKAVIEAGLKSEYKLFHVSDSHITYNDENSSEIDKADAEKCFNSWNEGKFYFAKCFGEFCDDRYKIEAHLILEALKEHSIRFGADALVLTGDIMDKITDSNIRYMKKFVDEYPKKVIYAMGNHGFSDAYGNKGNMYHRFEGIMNDPAFDVVDMGEFKIIVVDNSKRELSDEQIKRFEEEVSKDKKIVLAVHVPIFIGEFAEKMSGRLEEYFIWGKDIPCANSRKFIDLIEKNEEKFICVLSGHIHGATKYRITNNLVQYTASSALIGYGMEIIIK